MHALIHAHGIQYRIVGMTDNSFMALARCLPTLTNMSKELSATCTLLDHYLSTQVTMSPLSSVIVVAILIIVFFRFLFLFDYFVDFLLSYVSCHYPVSYHYSSIPISAVLWLHTFFYFILLGFLHSSNF